MPIQGRHSPAPQAEDRTGLGAFGNAKALALGATVVGVGRPLLQAALDGAAAVDEWVRQFALELRTAAFLSGVTRTRDLSTRSPVVTGDTRDWIAQLGYDRRGPAAK